ncbi:MAG: hypothetical protein LAP39_02280 [Acidobacteriia bacterium]|nr:hypothetical protein [Terriglobia bacterium]
MPARNEGGKVVSHDGGGIFRQPVERVIRIGAPAAKMKAIAGAQCPEASVVFRRAFQKKSMQAIIGLRVRARKAFVNQQRKIGFVGHAGRVGQRMIRLRPPVHLRPVPDVFSRPDRGIVQLTHTFIHE